MLNRLFSKGIVALAASAVVIALSSTANAQVTTNVYTNFVDTGSDITFSGLVGSFPSSDILFLTNTGQNYHPFGLQDFGSESTSCINVSAAGVYTFALNSDDGSYLFVDGGLVVSNGGAHGPQGASGNIFLTAGTHDLRVPFYEVFGGPSGVDVTLPAGVSYVDCVPEPGVVAFGILAGGSVLGLIARRRRS